MTRAIQVADILQFRAWCTAEEQASVNTFYFGVLSSADPSFTDLAAATEFDALVSPLYQAILPSTAAYNGSQCRIVISGGVDPGVIPQASTAGAGSGLIAGAQLPRQTCGLTAWQTNQVGPRYRGRSYWPFPAAMDDVTDGIPSTTYLGLVNALSLAIYNQVTLDAGLLDVSFVLFNRPEPSHVPPRPYNITPITNFIVRNKWATLRKRGSFGRANASPI